MVVAGVTAQLDPVWPAQLPPLQVYEVAAGLQLAVRVEELPALTEAGFASRVQLGRETDTNVKVVVTFWAALMATVQLPVPEQPPPDQPAKLEPVAAAAVSVTLVPEMKLEVQVLPQLMPAGLLLTVPEPAPLVLTESK
ncbi:hypothetical protein GALL_444120 [mine drainage metagenome]|uniref:Uncharacterized protein n=1 Tax=mine drainage metagenome TaxID=410659 RepID=A0A1J5Q232_9ZZZZ